MKNDTAAMKPHFLPKYSVVALNKLTARPLDLAHVCMSVSATINPLAANTAHAPTDIITAGRNPVGAAKYGIAKKPPPTVVPTTNMTASKSLARSSCKSNGHDSASPSSLAVLTAPSPHAISS
jgi:hypothetical protein